MTDISKDALNDVVARVTASVYKEMRDHEAAAFGVADLRDQLIELAKIGGGESAWTITYGTSRGSIENLRDVAKVGGESAWTISYSTSKSIVEKRQVDTGQG